MSAPWIPQETPFHGLDLATVAATEERNRARLLRQLLSLFVALTLAIAVIGFVSGALREGLISSVGALVYAALLLLLPRLGAAVTGILCTGWYFVLAFGAMATGDGIHDVTVVLLPAGLLIGALLLPRRLVAPLVAAVLATVAVVGVGKWARLLPVEGEPAPLAEVAVVTLLMLVTGVLTHLVVTSLESMIAKRQRAERLPGRIA